jgi:hypothetical protein
VDGGTSEGAGDAGRRGRRPLPMDGGRGDALRGGANLTACGRSSFPKEPRMDGGMRARPVVHVGAPR